MRKPKKLLENELVTTRINRITNIYDSYIGEETKIAAFVEIGGAVIGKRCKIQAHAFICPGVILEDDVFVGPGVVFTNVINPRAFIERKEEFQPTIVKRGATIGANATIRCGVIIGRYAIVGAGAVVLENVPDYCVVAKNPAEHLCFCTKEGERIYDSEWATFAPIQKPNEEDIGDLDGTAE